ncbi:MAG: hypothetical protein Q9224_001168 [Gallowayella concinna]
MRAIAHLFRRLTLFQRPAVIVLLIFGDVFDRHPLFDHEGSEEKIDTEDAKAGTEDGIIPSMIVDDAGEKWGNEQTKGIATENQAHPVVFHGQHAYIDGRE